MSFTTAAIVRTHLLESEVHSLRIEEVRIMLSGEADTLLPHRGLVVGSESVRWETSLFPQQDGPITLDDYDKASLAADHLLRGSFALTLGETLSTIYCEEVDYHVDYLAGSLFRVPGGTIPNHQPVYAFYNRATLFDSSSDYLLDAVNGAIRRRPGSAIPDGADILIDYNVLSGNVTDDLIEQSILEAQDLVIRSLSPQYNSGSTDQGLQTGSTLLVLSIIARDLAAEALARRTGTDAGGRAKEWQNLSSLFEARAWQTLRPFLDRYPVHTPEKRSNG